MQDLRHLDYRLDGSGVISYDYDPLGRTTCVTDPNGWQVRYAYRGDGRREYIQVYRPGTGIIYALYHFYDYQGRLYFLRRVGDDPTTNLAIFAYDANGNRIEIWYPLAGQENGPTVKLNYTHNRDNLLSSIITSSYDVTGEPNYCLSDADLDGLGRLTGAEETITDLAGYEITHSLSYTYDLRGQLKAASISNIAGQNWSAQYGYDKAGNLSAVEVDGSASNRTFQGDRLLTSSGAESYALGWDENGQLTGSAAATLEYDWDGRLYQGQSGSDWLNLKYDPDGNRWAKSSSRTGSRKYIVDTAADLPVILLELDRASDQVVKSYYYADEQLICQHNGDPNTGPRYFYLTDRIGSVRQVIDVNGYVRHLYSYGPFGKKLEADDDPDGPGDPPSYLSGRLAGGGNRQLRLYLR